jgi:hypothetical protein
MKTLKNVSTEMALHVLAYNMKRVMRILGVGGLMEAIRAKDLPPGQLAAPANLSSSFLHSLGQQRKQTRPAADRKAAGFLYQIDRVSRGR